jgi:hypothetical protein
MEQLTVLLARAGAWVEIWDLNPRGKVFYPSLVKALVGRYQFQKFPQAAEEFDENKGVTFAGGLDNDSNTPIEQFIIYVHGIVLETRNSTDASKAILESMFQWAANELGVAYRGPQTIRFWQYYSQLSFNSKIQLAAAVHPALQNLMQGIAESVEADSGERLIYEPVNVALNHDVMLRKHPYGGFSLQRRENLPFIEGKYFSDAPLPTDTHIQLLKRFETEMTEG